MFLTIHSAVGLAIGSRVSSPFIAFILGYLSHWLIDVIPHGDETLINKEKHTASKLKLIFFYFAIFDTIGIIILVYFLSSQKIISLTTPVIFGLLGAVTPDYLWGLYKIFNLKFLKPLHQIHAWFHGLIKHKIPFKYGLVIQLTIFIILILIIKS